MLGHAADMPIYDFDRLFFDESGYEVVSDMPGGDWRRNIRAVGYDWIIVNGEVTCENGRSTGAPPGELIATNEDRRIRGGVARQAVAAE